MTNEQLVSKIQNGDQSAILDLWEQTHRFVSKMAGQYLAVLRLYRADYGVEYNDLYNSGFLALVAAAETYRPDRGGVFTTWLAIHLKSAFARATGALTPKQRKDPLHRAISIDAPAYQDDEDGSTIEDRLEDKGATQAIDDVEKRIWNEQLGATFEKLLEKLPADERDVIRARFYDGRTQQEIGPGARRLENKALMHLRKPSIRRELEQFLEVRTSYYLHTGLESFNHTGLSSVERCVIEREKLAVDFHSGKID